MWRRCGCQLLWDYYVSYSRDTVNRIVKWCVCICWVAYLQAFFFIIIYSLSNISPKLAKPMWRILLFLSFYSILHTSTFIQIQPSIQIVNMLIDKRQSSIHFFCFIGWCHKDSDICRALGSIDSYIKLNLWVFMTVWGCMWDWAHQAQW